MSVVLKVGDGDGDQLRKARHCFFFFFAWFGLGNEEGRVNDRESGEG